MTHTAPPDGRCTCKSQPRGVSRRERKLKKNQKHGSATQRQRGNSCSDAAESCTAGRGGSNAKCVGLAACRLVVFTVIVVVVLVLAECVSCSDATAGRVATRPCCRGCRCCCSRRVHRRATSSHGNNETQHDAQRATVNQPISLSATVSGRDLRQ